MTHDADGNARFCGCPDNLVNELQAWPEDIVTIGVIADSLTSKASRAEQLEDLVEAMAVWSGATARLTVAGDGRLNGVTEANTDITIAYRVDAHGDGVPFDGKGTVVGHAWFPPDGRIHLDNAEDWGPAFRRLVTRHEAGHALGLGHSPKLGNVMYPYVTNQLHLGPWDVQQIQARYGVGTPDPDGPELPPVPAQPMLLGIRRAALTINGQPLGDRDQVKLFAFDHLGDGKQLGESTYYPGDLIIIEVAEPAGGEQFGLHMTSPIVAQPDGLLPWESTTEIEWVAVDIVPVPEEEPEEPETPEDPRWLPWRKAEVNLGQVTMKNVEIRFLDTRPREDPGEALVRRSTEHVQLHGDGDLHAHHRNLTDAQQRKRRSTDYINPPPGPEFATFSDEPPARPTIPATNVPPFPGDGHAFVSSGLHKDGDFEMCGTCGGGEAHHGG